MKRKWFGLLAMVMVLVGSLLFAGAPGVSAQTGDSLEIWLEENGGGTAFLNTYLDPSGTTTIEDVMADLRGEKALTVDEPYDLGSGYYSIPIAWTDFIGAFADGQWTVEGGFALINFGDLTGLDEVTVHLPGQVATVGSGDVVDPYTVVFHNASLTGISFAVSGTVSPTPSPTTSPRPTPTTSPRPTPTTSPRPTPTSPRPTLTTLPRPTPPSPTATPPATTEGGGFPLWAIIAIAVGALVVILLIVLLLLRGRRRPPAAGSMPPSSGATPSGGSKATRFCINCGAPIVGRTSFCPSCGASQKGPGLSSAPPSGSTSETVHNAEEDSISRIQ